VIPADSALISLLGRNIRRQSLLKPDDTVIVAISGGADSTALLDLLTRLPGYRLSLIAAHLNHCLRGSDSDADEEFCRQLAGHYRIPFESRRLDVRGLAESGQLNLEDAGRRARIDFLDELREKHGAAAVALAHHADDQAETVLMRLLRGSGMTGLSGMAYRNARGYVRPLLEISRSEIMLYLSERKLGWREDASNSDTTFLRNRVRHLLLPILEEYNPAVRASLSATASLLADEDALLGELTEQAFNESCRIENCKIVCSVRQLQLLNLPLRRRALRQAFKQLTGTLEGVGLSHINALCDLLDTKRQNSRLSLPQLVTVVKEYDRISFRKTVESVPEATPDLLINALGHLMLPTGGSLTVEIPESVDDFNSINNDTAFFGLDRTPFPWRVRTFLPGDRIIPFGMSGRKKVKDIFIDQKIPLSERRRIPLLFCGTDLIWIAGVCVSELCRINSHSAAIVRVIWRA
jgi:tRNA(Ile)-lysidine synthase